MNSTKRAIRAHSTVAKPGCYMTAEDRQAYRTVVEESELHDSAKRILKWLIGFKTPDMALSVNTIRERLPKATKRDHEAATAWVKPDGVAPNAKKALMSERTIQRVLRLLEDDGIGLGVLRLIAEEKRGRKIPRTYEIDLAPITDDGLAGVAGHAAEHNKRADVTHSEVSIGVTNGVSLEVTGWGVTSPSEIQSDTPSDTLLLKNTVFSSIHGAAADLCVAKQPPAMTKALPPRRSARLTHRPSVTMAINPPAGWMQ